MDLKLCLNKASGASVRTELQLSNLIWQRKAGPRLMKAALLTDLSEVTIFRLWKDIYDTITYGNIQVHRSICRDMTCLVPLRLRSVVWPCSYYPSLRSSIHYCISHTQSAAISIQEYSVKQFGGCAACPWILPGSSVGIACTSYSYLALWPSSPPLSIQFLGTSKGWRIHHS